MMAGKATYKVKALKSLGGLKRRLQLSIPAAAMDAEVHRRLQQKQKQARLPGFRAGRAPLPMIERQYGGSVRSDAALDLFGTACGQALADKKLELATRLQITELQDTGKGKDLLIGAEFEVYPTFKLASLEKLQIEQQQVEIAETDVGDLLESWRLEATTYEPKADHEAAADKDRLQVKMRVLLPENLRQEHKVEDWRELQVLVGGGRFPPEVEAAFVGVKKADSRSAFVVAAGESKIIVDPSVRPKAEYQFEVLEVAKPYVPTLEEMSASLPEEEGQSKMDTMRVKARELLQMQADNQSRQQLEKAVHDALLKANAKVPLPEGLVAAEQQALRESAASQMQIKPENLSEEVGGSIQAEAVKRVHFAILLRTLAKVHEVSPTTADITGLIEQEAQRYGERAKEFYQWANANEDYLRQVRAQAFEKTSIDVVLAKARITQKTVSFGEMQSRMQQNNPQPE